jgi:hypothetical protein
MRIYHENNLIPYDDYFAIGKKITFNYTTYTKTNPANYRDLINSSL